MKSNQMATMNCSLRGVFVVNIPDIPCLLLLLFQLRLQLHLLLQALFLPPHPFLQQRGPFLSHVLFSLSILLSPKKKTQSSHTDAASQETAPIIFISHTEARPYSHNVLLNSCRRGGCIQRKLVLFTFTPCESGCSSLSIHPCSLFKQHISTAAPELFTRAPVL